MPTRSFVVTSASQSASLNPQGQSEVSITVTNNSGKPARGAARPMPLGAANGAWLMVTGEKERNFAPNESHQITIRIQAPPDAPPGRYSFRVNLVSVQNPEEDFTEGPEVTFEIKRSDAPKPPAGKFPIWIIFVVLGVLIVGGGLAWLLLRSPGVVVPDVQKKTFEEASNTLAAASLGVAREDEVTRSNKVGIVLAQDPQAGAKARKGAAVKLTVEGQPNAAAVPDVVGMPIGKVKELFDAKGFKFAQHAEKITAQNPPAAGTIVEQTPKAGALLEVGGTVALTVEAPSVAVPNVSGNLSLSAAINALQSAKLNAGTVEQRAVVNVAQVNLVVGQEPGPGARVAPESKVRLFLGVQRRLNPSEWSRFLNTNIMISPNLRVIPR